MKAADEKMRITDVADTETMFRLIQSIPSPSVTGPYSSKLHGFLEKNKTNRLSYGSSQALEAKKAALPIGG